MIVTAPLPAGVSITASQNNICQGASVVFTATPVNGGTPGYQWFVNTLPVGSNQPTYTFNPNNGDQVKVVMTSNLSCVTGSPSTSNTIVMIVSPLPSPTISGPATVCNGAFGNNYSTETGMVNYQWTVSTGGVITSGSGTSSITVTWSTLGAQTVSVIYNNISGCIPAAPATFNVMVSTMPAPTITGNDDLCANSGYYNYSTESGMMNYQWIVSQGGFITAGAGTNQVQVTWSLPGNQTISVNYTNGAGCSANVPTTFIVAVHPLPAPSGNIVGSASVCEGMNNVAYTVGPIQNAVSYVWTLPAGAFLASGYGTNIITVNYSQNAVSGNMTVYGINNCGTGILSPEFHVTVNPIPSNPIATVNGQILESSIPNGNQWYHEGVMIPGATGQTYFATQPGWYWTIVTQNGCASDASNHVYVIGVGIEEQYAGTKFLVYPVPNDGRFTISIVIPRDETFRITVYNNIGSKCYEMNDVKVNGGIEQKIDLRPLPDGVYSIVFSGKYGQTIRRFVCINSK
jgi:hypothetical protein